MITGTSGSRVPSARRQIAHGALPRATIWTMIGAMLLATIGPTAAAEARRLRWPELIPAHLADVPLTPAPIDHDGFGASLQQLSPWGERTMSELLVAELDGNEVTISGYVVPLELAENDRVHEFLLVPYFGACVHVPPPPPNQVIHVTTSEGLDVARVYEAWSVTGILRIQENESALASSGYAITADDVRLYGS